MLTIRTVSLFSGAGGLDIGFERAGFEIVYASELNCDSAATWCANREDKASAMHCGDINEQLEELSQLSDVDVIIGGPPCQGFSVAGKMDEGDPRNKLVDVFLEVVSLLRPSAFLMENVKALAISDRWREVRDSSISKACSLGYEVELDVYRASDYGVPENRERMFFVGHLPDVGDGRSFGAALRLRKEKPKPLRKVLQDVGAFGTDANPDTCTAKVVVAKKPVIRNSAFSGMLVNGAGRPVRLDGFSQTLTASMGGNNTPIVDENALKDSTQPNWFEDLRDLLLSKREASTIAVPEYVRRLTLAEAAAIQTFPSGYKFVGSKCSRYRQIGNAVPCRLGELAALAMRETFFSEKHSEVSTQT